MELEGRQPPGVGKEKERLPGRPCPAHAELVPPLARFSSETSRARLAQAQSCASFSRASAVAVGWRSWFHLLFPPGVTKPRWCGS